MAEALFEGSEINLPFSLEAEQSVLGAVLLKPDCLSSVLEYISAESFYRKQHQQIFSIMLQMYTTAQGIDVITVLEEVKKQEVFSAENEAKVYLTQLVQVVPGTSNVLYYAKIVQEKYYMRRLIGMAQDVLTFAAEPQTESRSLMELTEQKLYDIRKGKDSTGLIHINRILMDVYGRIQSPEQSKASSIPSGFGGLDRITNGLNRSDLILLAARPAMGKSTFAFNIATNVAKKGYTVAVFSLEMSREQVVNKILSAMASVDGTKLRAGDLPVGDWSKIADVVEMMSQWEMYIDDTPGITVAEIKAKLRRLPQIDLVVIDYLQLLTSGRNIDNRVQEVSEITRNLKIMAKEMNIPLLTLSQLSRSSDKRTDHRPMLSDLRESGSIEQDADMVMFLYREEYYEDDTEERGQAECILAKNRHGATDTVKLIFDGAHSQFVSRENYRDAP